MKIFGGIGFAAVLVFLVAALFFSGCATQTQQLSQQSGPESRPLQVTGENQQEAEAVQEPKKDVLEAPKQQEVKAPDAMTEGAPPEIAGKIDPKEAMKAVTSVSGGMGELCNSSFQCMFFCQKNFDKCAEFCAQNPGNGMCASMSSMMGGMGRRMPSLGGATFDVDANKVPRFVRQNFIDLAPFERISKFRGGYGHDYSRGTGETCRSMKHYFWAKGGEPSRARHNPPWNEIKYFAPVDGTISFVMYSDTYLGTKEAQFRLNSTERPAFTFVFHHVALDPSIKSGSVVKAGQFLGKVSTEEQHGEIAVSVSTPKGETLVSFFDVASKELMAEYEARGFKYKDVIISKEERDAKPMACDEKTEEGRFTGAKGVSGPFHVWQSGPENWVTLKD